jgi:hypothetical protein
LYGQYSAIGLLVAAKGIIRFNEKDRQEIKTEYLVIGTLMSIALAIITGWQLNYEVRFWHESFAGKIDPKIYYMDSHPIVLERTYDAPVKKVWKALTDKTK